MTGWGTKFTVSKVPGLFLLVLIKEGWRQGRAGHGKLTDEAEERSLTLGLNFEFAGLF